MDVTIYAGNAGDRNERGMRGAVDIGRSIAARFGVQTETIREAVPLCQGGWREQLLAATPNLRLLAERVSRCMKADKGVVLTMGRCAAGIATLPIIAQYFPEASIIWFDAHGDSNLPMTGDAADMGYLGGMVITGAAGEWETGFGSGVELRNVILVGSRDLDPPELDRIASGQIKLVPVGPNLSERLKWAIGSRPAYIHLDCDVMDAGLLATEYQVPDGLSWLELRAAFEALAECEVIGLEIAEYEATWADGRPSDLAPLLAAIDPILKKLMPIK